MKQTWLFQTKTYYINGHAPIHSLSDHMLESSAYLSREAIRSSNQHNPRFTELFQVRCPNAGDHKWWDGHIWCRRACKVEWKDASQESLP